MENFKVENACYFGFNRYHFYSATVRQAGVAQLAEHRFCKPTVVSSTLTASSEPPKNKSGGYPSG